MAAVTSAEEKETSGGHRSRTRTAHLRTRPEVRLPLVVCTSGAHAHGRRPCARGTGDRRQGNDLPRFLQPTRQHQHWPPAPNSGGGHSGPGRDALHHCAPTRQRPAVRGSPVDRGASRSGILQGVLHEWRDRSRRARGAYGPAPHWPPQGAVDLSQLPRGHVNVDQLDR